MSVPPGMTPKGRQFLALLLLLILLLIFTQMVTSLVVFGGVFIHSSETLISPFHFCVVGQDGGLSCDQPHNHNSDVGAAAAAETNINILRPVVVLCLYAPLVLVAFALLAFLFAVYAEDRGTLWFSVVCQVTASTLTLVGITVFGGLYWSYMSLADMTLWYYICVGVHVELAATALLTCVSVKRLTADWM